MDILKNTAGNILSYNGTPLGTTWSAGGGGSYDTSTWIPAMTSRTAPSPFIVSAESNYDSTTDGIGGSPPDRYAGWHAFDGNLTPVGIGTTWYSWNDNRQHWLKVDLGAGNEICIWKYKIVGQNDARAIKSWIIQGSNDDSTYDDLDTVSNVATWTDSEVREYEIVSPSTTPYRYFRLYWVANQGQAAGAATLVEWNIYKYTP